MPTQSIAGYAGVMEISSDGGTSYQPVAELQDVTLKITTKMGDATSHSSGGFEESSPLNQGWTATVGVLQVFADAGQSAALTGVTSKTKLKFRFDPTGTATGKPRREGFGYITDWEEKEPTAALETAQLTIQGTGPLTVTTQT